MAHKVLCLIAFLAIVVKHAALGPFYGSVVAGNGDAGSGADGVKATSSALNRPYQPFYSSALSSLLIANYGNNRVRKVDSNGIVTKFAGCDSTLSYVSGAAATSTCVYTAIGVCADSLGTVYVSANLGQRVFKISPGTYLTSSFAGTGVASTSSTDLNGDNGPATSATLYNPSFLHLNNDGSIVYFSEYENNRIRAVSADGIISTVAGTGVRQATDASGPATQTPLSGPTGVYCDSSGRLYISEQVSNLVKRVTSGIISVVAGAGSSGYTGDGGSATSAKLNVPLAVYGDSRGAIYITDRDNKVVRAIDTNGIIATVIGTGNDASTVQPGLGTSTPLGSPQGLHVDTTGSIYVADVSYNVGGSNVRRAYSLAPTVSPSFALSLAPTIAPSMIPTTLLPTIVPSRLPSIVPSLVPTIAPSMAPSVICSPSKVPTVPPTLYPSSVPSLVPTLLPSTSPTAGPSFSPTLLPSVIPTSAPPLPQVFSYTGTSASFVVPDGVTSIYVSLSGAGGSTVDVDHTCVSGKGAVVTQTLSVTPGQTLYVLVGGQGTSASSNNAGYNGGGASSGYLATGGSGATDIRTSLNDLSSRLVVAGGGGGCCTWGGQNNGGAGGLTGGDGLSLYSPATTPAGGGGNSTAGGSGGKFGYRGSLGQGGGNSIQYTAGGGGGYYGGGGAYYAGGGGGSSYVTNGGTVVSGSNTGHGSATISYVPTVMPSRAPSLSPSAVPSRPPSIVPTTQPTIQPSVSPTLSPSSYASTLGPYYGTVVAGNGDAGSGADIIKATSSALNRPFQPFYSPALSALLFADYGNNRVRKVDGNGIVTKFAGSDSPSSFVSGAAATSTYIYTALGVCADSVGAVYVSAIVDQRVFRVSPGTYLTSSFAGTGVASTSSTDLNGDNGPATSATLYNPCFLHLNNDGSIVYFSDYENNRVRAVSAAGIITTVAGTGVRQTTDASGPATQTPLSGPTGVYCDSSGRLYISEQVGNLVKRVTSGIISVVAGAGSGYTGDGGPATSAKLSAPTAVYGNGGAFFFTDRDNKVVRAIDTNGIIATVIGTGNDVTMLLQTGMGTSTSVGSPQGLHVDTTGSIYVSDESNSVGGSIVRRAYSLAPTVSPSTAPSTVPSLMPSKTPTIAPTLLPTLQPSLVPTLLPSLLPTNIPSVLPTVVPSIAPSLLPSICPSLGPTIAPSLVPSILPSVMPSNTPTQSPSTAPTQSPSLPPSCIPSAVPTAKPTLAPSEVPSIPPTRNPTVVPSLTPSTTPTVEPSEVPSTVPTFSPTDVPTNAPSSLPSILPTNAPSLLPTEGPTIMPSLNPTCAPSVRPSMTPSSGPTLEPSVSPTLVPTFVPTIVPTLDPSGTPTCFPTRVPSFIPSVTPSLLPSVVPSTMPLLPSYSPSTVPTFVPTSDPTFADSTCCPSLFPTAYPSFSPTVVPSLFPSSDPSIVPSVDPSLSPSLPPSLVPTSPPSQRPTVYPSLRPTPVLSLCPSAKPSFFPSVTVPSVSARPSTPTVKPSQVPSRMPSRKPTKFPTVIPSLKPTGPPTIRPTIAPTAPSVCPTLSLQPVISMTPTEIPTKFPSRCPSVGPTVRPSLVPTVTPTLVPSVLPSTALPSTAIPSAAPSTVDFYISQPKATLPSNQSISVIGPSDLTFKIVLSWMTMSSGPFGVPFTDIELYVDPTAEAFLISGGHLLPSSVSVTSAVDLLSAGGFDTNKRSASVLGDVNGDGYNDLIIGDPYLARCYVMFGSKLGLVYMTTGFTIFGDSEGDLTGWSVSGAGDVNNDTLSDIIVGAPSAAAGLGAFYVIYGRPFDNVDVYLSNLSVSQGFAMYGTQKSDYLGISVSFAGDVNGDHCDDVIAGGLMTSTYFGGAAFVVYGGRNIKTSSLSDLSLSQGFKMSGASYSYAGCSVSGAGDVNRDGFDDVLIGTSPQRSSLTTAAFLVYGSKTEPGSVILASMMSSEGVLISGGGMFVLFAGDVDHDGFSDILVCGDIDGTITSSGGYILYSNTSYLTIVESGPSVPPTVAPTLTPSKCPSRIPSTSPSISQSRYPSRTPSVFPTAPTVEPTPGASQPSSHPSARPTFPTVEPSAAPSEVPTVVPSESPSEAPSIGPSESPTEVPTVTRTINPTDVPTVKPTSAPSTLCPTVIEATHRPFSIPTLLPTVASSIIEYNAYVIENAAVVADQTRGYQNYIVNTSENVFISNSLGNNRYTLYPHRASNLTIKHFNRTTDVVDLTAFTTITEYKQLNITSGSVIVTLPGLQIVHILNLNPGDVSVNNFLLYRPSTNNADSSSETAETLSVVAACLVAVGGLMFGAMLLLKVCGHSRWYYNTVPTLVSDRFLMEVKYTKEGELMRDSDESEDDVDLESCLQYSGTVSDSPHLSEHTFNSQGSLMMGDKPGAINNEYTDQHFVNWTNGHTQYGLENLNDSYFFLNTQQQSQLHYHEYVVGHWSQFDSHTNESWKYQEEEQQYHENEFYQNGLEYDEQQGYEHQGYQFHQDAGEYQDDACWQHEDNYQNDGFQDVEGEYVLH